MRSVWLLPGWAVGMVLGAVGLRFGAPERYSEGIAALMGSEPVHVVAHLCLYGTQTAIVGRVLGGSVRWMFGIPLLTGVVQELSQTLGQRSFGAGEVFDLGVDVTAIGLVIAAFKLYGRYKAPYTDYRRSPPA